MNEVECRVRTYTAMVRASVSASCRGRFNLGREEDCIDCDPNRCVNSAYVRGMVGAPQQQRLMALLAEFEALRQRLLTEPVGQDGGEARLGDLKRLADRIVCLFKLAINRC